MMATLMSIDIPRHLRSIRATSPIVGVAIDLILWATVGFVALGILATASTVSFQTVIVLLGITVVSIIATIAVVAGFLKRAGISV